MGQFRQQPKPDRGGKSRKKTPTAPRRPDVILDVEYDQGQFFLVLKNITRWPVTRVRVSFDTEIRGLGGEQAISGLPLFNRLEFLAPHKEIRTFLDASWAYFERNEPVRFTAKIMYRDVEGEDRVVAVTHDLEVYRQLIETRPQRDPGIDGIEDKSP